MPRGMIGLLFISQRFFIDGRRHVWHAPHRLCRGIFGALTYTTSGPSAGGWCWPFFGGRPRRLGCGANPSSTHAVSGPPKVVTIRSTLMYLWPLMYLRMSDCSIPGSGNAS